MSISSLNNLQLNRLRGHNIGRVLLEKMYHLLLNQLSTKQTQRPKCRACSVRKIYTISSLSNFQLNRLRGHNVGRVLLEKYTISSLSNFQLNRLRGLKGRVLLETISISSLTNFQSNRLRGPRAGIPNAGQGRVLLEKYVPSYLSNLHTFIFKSDMCTFNSIQS